MTRALIVHRQVVGWLRVEIGDREAARIDLIDGGLVCAGNISQGIWVAWMLVGLRTISNFTSVLVGWPPPVSLRSRKEGLRDRVRGEVEIVVGL